MSLELNRYNKMLSVLLYNSGQAVAQLAEVLRYRSEGLGFDSRWCNWNILLTESFRSHYDPGVDSASSRMSTRNISWESNGGRCVGLTTLPPSCAACLWKCWESQPPGNRRGCPDRYRDFFTIVLVYNMKLNLGSRSSVVCIVTRLWIRGTVFQCQLG